VNPRQLLNRLSASSSIGWAEIRPNLHTHSVHRSARTDSTAIDDPYPTFVPGLDPSSAYRRGLWSWWQRYPGFFY
jgi:hypothetical protein